MKEVKVAKTFTVGVPIDSGDVLAFIGEAGPLDLVYLARQCILHLDPDEDFAKLREFVTDPYDLRVVDILEQALKDIDAAIDEAKAKI